MSEREGVGDVDWFWWADVVGSCSKFLVGCCVREGAGELVWWRLRRWGDG